MFILKMKRFFLISLTLLCSVFTIAQKHIINIGYWHAFQSKYSEQPQWSITDPHPNFYFWGEYNTSYYRMDTRFRLLKWLAIHPKFMYGFVADNRMKLGGENNSLTINGTDLFYEINVDFSFFNNEQFELALFVGYNLHNTNLNFNNRVVNNVVIDNNCFAKVKSNLSGYQFGIKVEFYFNEHLSVRGNTFTSPFYENNSSDTWYNDQLRKNGKGYRSGGEVNVNYLTNSFVFSFGYRGDNMFFNYPKGLFDLNIHFSGLVASFGYMF